MARSWNLKRIKRLVCLTFTCVQLAYIVSGRTEQFGDANKQPHSDLCFQTSFASSATAARRSYAWLEYF